MPKSRKNNQLEIFRLKSRLAMEQYVDKMKLFIAEERTLGSTSQDIKKIRADPESTWNMEKNALRNILKREAAGLINRIHIRAYTAGL